MNSYCRLSRAGLQPAFGRLVAKALVVVAILAGALAARPLPAAAAVAAQCGGASWYALDGRRTANGEIMNSSRLTAAHRYLPMGSVVTVRNKRNGRSVTVRINDRGPFVGGRIIDVSRAAAQRLGMISTGVASVCMSRGTAYASNDDEKRSVRKASRGHKYSSRRARAKARAARLAAAEKRRRHHHARVSAAGERRAARRARVSVKGKARATRRAASVSRVRGKAASAGRAAKSRNARVSSVAKSGKRTAAKPAKSVRRNQLKGKEAGSRARYTKNGA